MEINEFADKSKESFTQIRIVENLVKGDSYKEANKMLSGVEKTCKNLESLMTPNNQIQTRIVSNRRREMGWIQDEIQTGMAKAKSKPVKKRTAK